MQYGFRKGRSTSQPLFLCRRIQDLSEAFKKKLTLVFLDWEKAFDNIYQDELINALGRMNIPEEMLEMIKILYDNPQFRIKDREGKSTYRTQQTGIRQGCPLSPYLFVIFMTVLFHDVHEELEGKLNNVRFDFIDFMEILYADDTLLIGDNAKILNLLIAAIEKHSERYGMKLNKNKCVHISMNCKAKIKFSDGKEMKSADEATYLGSNMSKKHLTRREIEARISSALNTAKKLNIFFKKTKCSEAWKLQVYNAVIISRLLYGIESLELTDSLKTRLDAFQIRGLRHILGIEHSFWSRVTNKEIIEKANVIAETRENITEGWEQIIRNKGEKDRKIKLISEIMEERKTKLLGHIMRRDEKDPLKQVCFDDEGYQHIYETRRVGRPRIHWVRETMKNTFSKLYNDEIYIEDDEEIIFRLLCAAENKEF